MSDNVCRCELCLALLELAQAAERALQTRKRERKLRLVGDGRKQGRAA